MILLTVCGVMVVGLRTAHERVVLYSKSLNSLHRSNLQHINWIYHSNDIVVVREHYAVSR